MQTQLSPTRHRPHREGEGEKAGRQAERDGSGQWHCAGRGTQTQGKQRQAAPALGPCQRQMTQKKMLALRQDEHKSRSRGEEGEGGREGGNKHACHLTCHGKPG